MLENVRFTYEKGIKKAGVTTGLLEKPTETRCSRVGEKQRRQRSSSEI